MSTSFTGARAIASSTNATPIAVTFSAAHGLLTGAVVEISGHLVNTAANGSWTVTVTGGTTLTLNSSVGNGVGAATGNAYIFPGTAALQSDGDVDNAAGRNAPLEGLQSSVQFLHNRFDQQRLGVFPITPPQSITRVVKGTPEAIETEWAHSVGGGIVPTWVQIALAGELFIPVSLPNGSVWTAASVGFQGLPTHASLPGMPLITPIKVDLTTGVMTTCAGFSAAPDTSATHAIYDAYHTIATGSVGTEVINDARYKYYIQLDGESTGGGSGAPGARYFGATVTFTLSALDIGAA